MSKVVFVGNVPYNMSEEDLIDVFKSVGQVVGFRLVFDRDTGKPRGYGFCEFADHETALSSVRNLNGTDVGGRPLRIDLADSDPFLEGKTTVRGEIVDAPGDGGWNRGGQRRNDPNAFLRDLPPGVPVPSGGNALDVITHNLATMNPSQLIEVLAQMKAFIITHPEQARVLLVAHPQLAYALFQALVLNKIVDSSVLQRMLAASGGMPPAPTHAPTAPQIHAQPAMPSYGQAPFAPPIPPPGMPMSVPPQPPSSMYPVQGAQAAAAANPYYRTPSTGGNMPPPAPIAPIPPPQASPAPQVATAGIDPSQQALLMHVLSLTPEQINAMPQQEQETIRALRQQFMGARA